MLSWLTVQRCYVIPGIKAVEVPQQGFFDASERALLELFIYGWYVWSQPNPRFLE